ncbi:MAG TPA: flagellar type III secretion system pore protein FliP [Phycisphaerae bacterium]|jgi:flagellar biosynthetic protein FliP|nr:flagellar type III secretion system pore protein FliP [Phycisphaerae bacterium]HOB74220.1 flagellar type III secretion system pore protein FliP [Phycisphaerae bacterium]HOJ55008.1 flagellar type III secretion system pore protein FliP [Phycisphaerae bacterium]HOL26971.1 flagellar type III secretion system pore protein FliP [Phycisphaerae bacterium]HPP21400.1 flagellar type III secretion system pore protein FliP [Phycisphaerae bacterium]
MWEHGGSRWLTTVALVLALPVVLCAQTPAPANPAGSGLSSGAASGTVDNPLGIPDLTRVLPAANTREQVSTSLQIFVIMTVLSLAPAILMMTTCFTRIIIVLGLLRQAIGTQQLPPGQVMVGLSLFITFLVMAPTYDRIWRDAVRPWLDNAPGMTQSRALAVAESHMRDFMFSQIERTQNEEDIFLFLEYSQKREIPVAERITRADVPTRVLIPAFILSELKTAFVMGFRIYLPFLVIDMVIATVLISMGMLMLPPVMVSLPFKLLLFVLADGWHLVVGSLLNGFAV